VDAILRNFLLSVLVPAALAGASYFALSAQTRLPRPWTALLAGLEATIAFGLGYYFLAGRLPMLPKESTHWLIYVGLVAAVAAALIAHFDSASSRVVVVVMAVSLVAFALVRPLWLSTWKPVQAVWLTGMILAFGTIGWTMLHLAVQRLQKPWAMASIVMIFVCSSVAVAASGSVSLAQFGGIFAAVLAPLVWIAWRRPNSAVFAMAVPFSALALLAVLINARFYAELGIVSAGLILLSPIAGWALARFGPDEGFLTHGYVRFLVMTAPAAGGAIFAILTSSPSGY
jgi:hypothetical protein